VIYVFAVLIVIALGVDVFAICKRDSVKANLKFFTINFSLEAKNEKIDRKG